MAIINISPSSSYSSPTIQKALDKTGTNGGKKLSYSEVHLNKGTYLLNSRMYLNSDTKITCDDNTVLKLAPTNFGQNPIIGQKENSITGLDISGFTYNGNYENQTATPNDHGVGYGNLFHLKNITNSNFHHLKGGHSEGDFIRLEHGSGIEIYNCDCKELGHEFAYLIDVNNSDVHDNKVVCRGDGGIRIKECHDVKIHANYIKGSNAAYSPAIQIEKANSSYGLYNIDVYWNTLVDTYGPGIWLSGIVAGARDVNIHNNLIVRCGQMPTNEKISQVGGIAFDGIDALTIKNNTFINCFGYSIGAMGYVNGSALKSLKATINRNIIYGTKVSNYPGINSGAGIVDLTGRYTINSSENCLFGNISNYYKVSSSSDILQDPGFIDKSSENYHLKSVAKAPCIFKTYELGCYDGTDGAGDYIPPNPPSVTISQPTKDDLTAFVQGLIDSGIITESDIVEYKNT